MVMPFYTGPASLKVLQNPNYRKYFLGQLISMTGTWTQVVAQSWLVYSLTHSGYWLGVINFAQQLPAFFMSPLAGVVADKLDRRRILITVQIVGFLEAAVLAALVFTGKVQLWQIVVLSVVLGVNSAFEMTARHSFAVDMVGKDELSSAIALNSVVLNAARVFGPAIAGVLLAAVGEAWCFVLNSLSYLPVIAGLVSMRLQRKAAHRARGSVARNIVEGMRYALRDRLIFQLLCLSSFVCLVSSPYVVLLPVLAKHRLGGGPQTLGWLTGMLGVGAVVSALLFTAIHDAKELKRRLSRDVLFWGVGLLMLGVSSNFWISVLAVFVIGFFMMSLFPLVNNAIQHRVDDQMRGRVMSLYTMTFLGTMPLGSLAIGWCSDRFSAPAAIVATGIATVLMALTIAVVQALRMKVNDALMVSSSSRSES